MEVSREYGIAPILCTQYTDTQQPNVLVGANGRAQITNSGSATITDSLDSIRDTSVGHDHGVRWFAPEILEGVGTYSKEGDVFSLAMVVVEVPHR